MDKCSKKLMYGTKMADQVRAENTLFKPDLGGQMASSSNSYKGKQN